MNVLAICALSESRREAIEQESLSEMAVFTATWSSLQTPALPQQESWTTYR